MVPVTIQEFNTPDGNSWCQVESTPELWPQVTSALEGQPGYEISDEYKRDCVFATSGDIDSLLKAHGIDAVVLSSKFQ